MIEAGARRSRARHKLFTLRPGHSPMLCRLLRSARLIRSSFWRFTVGVLAAGAALLAIASVGATDSAADTPAFSSTAGSPVAAGSSPYAVAFSPAGGLLVAANYLSANLSVFTENQQTGALTSASDSPVSVGNGSGTGLDGHAQ